MIKCKPIGGISNRLKCIISAMAFHGDIELNWEVPTSGGGVRCTFNDLYVNDFSEKPTTTLLPYNGHEVSHCEFINPKMNTNNSGDKNNLDSIITEKYLNAINTLQPIEYINNRIIEEHSKLPPNTTTVSLRTFKSFKGEYDSWGQHFKIDELYKYLDNIQDGILLTCDDTDTMGLVKGRYGDKIITTPKRTKFGDFNSIEGMQDILIDLYLGGLNDTIYGTHMSSFSEMQWWVGQCKPKYVNMKLHKR